MNKNKTNNWNCEFSTLFQSHRQTEWNITLCKVESVMFHFRNLFLFIFSAGRGFYTPVNKRFLVHYVLLQGLGNAESNMRKNAEEREDIDALQNKLKVKTVYKTVVHLFGCWTVDFVQLYTQINASCVWNQAVTKLCSHCFFQAAGTSLLQPLISGYNKLVGWEIRTHVL